MTLRSGSTVSAYMHHLLLDDHEKLKKEIDTLKNELEETKEKLQVALANQAPPKRPRGRPRKITNGTNSTP